MSERQILEETRKKTLKDLNRRKSQITSLSILIILTLFVWFLTFQHSEKANKLVIILMIILLLFTEYVLCDLFKICFKRIKKIRKELELLDPKLFSLTVSDMEDIYQKYKSINGQYEYKYLDKIEYMLSVIKKNQESKIMKEETDSINAQIQEIDNLVEEKMKENDYEQ